MHKKLIIHSLIIAFFVASAAKYQHATLNYNESVEKPIIIGTTSGPISWYQDNTIHGGLQFHLSQAFANHIHHPVEMRAFRTRDGLIAALEAKEVDIIAIDTVASQFNPHQFDLGPAYQHNQAVLIRRKGTLNPLAHHVELAELSVIKDSPFDLQLTARTQDLAHIKLNRVEVVDMIGMIEQVAKAKINFAVVSSDAFHLVSALYPDLSNEPIDGFTAEERWVMRAGHPERTQTLQRFFSSQINDEALALIHAKLEPTTIEMDRVNGNIFINRMHSRLPKFKRWIEEASEKHRLPFTLLAAVGYQESHWNPNARSHTGVRGFMMLTRNTAQELEVSDRLDAKQSIFGGARYLRRLMNNLPERLTPENRTAFALASYNMGRAHLEDARILAQRNGADPDSWKEVSPFVLKLQDPKYNQLTRNGYARGGECVSYVDNIMRYQDVLEQEKTMLSIAKLSPMHVALSPDN